MLRTNLNLSLNASDHTPLAGLDAVNTFITVRNAAASFNGSVGALCIE
jgi:hypothetical protein